MIGIGVQTRNVVDDITPGKGFGMLREAGFSCADFSLNGYLKNASIYKAQLGGLFDLTVQELEGFFEPHKNGAKAAGITVNQMHMPYPVHVPGGKREVNEFLWNIVAPKSMMLCGFFGCPHIVVHGFKLARILGSEEAEWAQMERFIDSIAPMAKEMGIVICIENLYDSLDGHLVTGPCCDAGKAVERIDRINDRYRAEVLGFCFDAGHANLTGIDTEKFVTSLGHRLKVLHIHDNDGIGDLHQLPFTMAGENKSSADWDGFVRGLRNIGFDGTLSFETAPVLNAFPDEMKPDVLSFIARTGRYFASEINNKNIF